MDSSVVTWRDEAVAHVKLNRPARRNAIDLDMYHQVCNELRKAGEDESVQAIVLSAEGDTFSVGEDFEYLAKLQAEGRLSLWEAGYRGWVPVTWHNPKLVIAVVRGEALGLGCELALLSDMTFADESAFFGHPEMRQGIVGPTIWPWLARAKLAKEYLATGRKMPAAEAAACGLINRRIPAEQLEAEVQALVQDLVSMPAGTPAANKRRIGWAYRDVSRVLCDDLNYQVSPDWIIASRQVDFGFYKTVAEKGVKGALKHRDDKFNG